MFLLLKNRYSPFAKKAYDFALKIGGRPLHSLVGRPKCAIYLLLEIAILIRPSTPIPIAPAVEYSPLANRNIRTAMTTKTMPTMKRDLFN
jgi:hypothetical protein